MVLALGQHLIGEDKSVAHTTASKNVKNFFLFFLVCDLMVVVSYGRLTLPCLKSGRCEDVGLFLRGMVIFTYTCDAVLACALLWSLVRSQHASQKQIHWEDLRHVISMNWMTNSASFLILACQRFFDSHGDRFLLIAAVIYLGARVAKLRRLRQLKQAVNHACESHEPDRYNELLAVWAVERAAWVDKCVASSNVLAVVVVVLTLSVAVGIDRAKGQEGRTGTLDMNFAMSGLADDALADAASGCAIGGSIANLLGPEAVPVGGALGCVGGLITHEVR